MFGAGGRGVPVGGGGCAKCGGSEGGGVGVLTAASVVDRRFDVIGEQSPVVEKW